MDSSEQVRERASESNKLHRAGTTAPHHRVHFASL